MDEFTNSDPRLRPASPPKANRQPNGPVEYPVTPETFPELDRAFRELAHKANADEYHLVILGDNFGGAGTDFSRKVIGIGIRVINSGTLEEVQGTLGHEFGHELIRRYPELQSTVRADKTDQQNEELTADRIGVCLTGDWQSAIAELASGTSIDPALSVEERIESLSFFKPSDCPVMKSDQSKTATFPSFNR
ncbi:hypothetical protein [Novosphingobium naphthalenivorans]|uniref:hypothetical protein n=1 Tax=Novosphingobium naphthalenivorans TaxID=273168 RepID=UPI000A91CC79|nr:hypothetical protein [Novosphingobium naphthalenivorans]